MYILPVSNSKRHNPCYNKTIPNFTAHPDFKKICTTSCYFRRGPIKLPHERYNDIEVVFSKIFGAELKEPIKMLIIGIGKSQEVFSYLASIKGIIGNKPLKDCLDLYIVDLQSKPSKEQLWFDSFSDLLPHEKFPKYAGKSFVADYKYTYPKPEPGVSPTEHLKFFKMIKSIERRYRVKNEIFDFVWETYNNPQKSKWSSPIQDVITHYRDEEFNTVSANNILGYIILDNEYFKTLSNIKRIIKTGEYFISDPLSYVEDREIFNTYRQVYWGIYQKI